MRRLIIDADSIIYTAASVLEAEWPSEEEFPEGLPLYISLHVDPNEVLEQFWADIRVIERIHKPDETLVAITDSAENFRLAIDPTYKGNRKHTRKPLAVRTVRNHLAKDPRVYFRPHLEADDVIGILMTMKKHAKDDMICWSPDKDLRTVPGLHVDLKADRPSYDRVTLEEADRFHLEQTLSGDSVDGIVGIPGIGPKKAKEHLATCGATWDCVMQLAKQHGMNEYYMLKQARLARILRASDYDFYNKRPILWTP
jgi:DNA polymerase-1